MKIILGSGSKWRAKIFAQLGLEFETMAPEIDEKAIRRDDPQELVLAIAEAKSRALRDRIQGPALLITSDQVVAVGGRVLEKPRDEAEAREFMRRAGDHPAETITSINIFNTETGRSVQGVDAVRIFMTGLPDAVIDALIAKGDVFTCAGGIDIEDPLVQPYIKKIEGDLDSVIGLPLKLTRQLLEEAKSGV
ncbi:MAG: Maf family protein [Patescibacteria group bacterium]|jgi:septum formation protein